MAREIGADRAFVIVATHGKRAIDNLARFKPHLLPRDIVNAMEEFERSVLLYADAYGQRASALRLRSCPTPIPTPTGTRLLLSAIYGTGRRNTEGTACRCVGASGRDCGHSKCCACRWIDEWKLELEAVEDSKWVALCASCRVSNCHTTLGQALSAQASGVER